ncbi:hypothetical protein HZS_6311 [Henneguya salminicola]|nr:hypothetical protein HZS_6311 [Henneguya salminicola]
MSDQAKQEFELIIQKIFHNNTPKTISDYLESNIPSYDSGYSKSRIEFYDCKFSDVDEESSYISYSSSSPSDSDIHAENINTNIKDSGMWKYPELDIFTIREFNKKMWRSQAPMKK